MKGPAQARQFETAAIHSGSLQTAHYCRSFGLVCHSGREPLADAETYARRLVNVVFQSDSGEIDRLVAS